MSSQAPTVVLVGTLDTKGPEYRFLRDRLVGAGCRVLLVDCGVHGRPGIVADVSRAEVARAAGVQLEDLVASGDRESAVRVMARGAAVVVRRLLLAGRLQALLGAGGSNGTRLLAEVCAALPVGVPKVVVSTVAAGDTRPSVPAPDVTMVYPVVDLAGFNRISARFLANAAAAAAGMAGAPRLPSSPDRPMVGLTTLGATTAGAMVLYDRLQELGYEVLVFHATGVGGASMESLVRSGELVGVADLTTTELADDMAGGICSAGPTRLTAAGQTGLPQVVSLGALDIVKFGPPETVPARYADRLLHAHNPAVTLMRTNVRECVALGRRIAARLNEARGPVTLFVPEGGFSQISVPGGVFADEAADRALVQALIAELDRSVPVVRMDTDVNDPVLATAMADTLDAHCRARAPRKELVPG